MIRSFSRVASNSWRAQSWALRIMRLWLGGTWIYAGWDKATDAGFLTPESASFIGSQLDGYATQSPLDQSVFDTLTNYPTAVGITVMLSEFAVGLATLLWVAPTLAALGGLSISVGLWLASTFQVSPYFLASNTAYAILWLAYLLLIREKRKGFTMSIERRGVMRIGIIAGMSVAFAGVGKFFTPKSTQDVAAAAAAGTKIVKLSSLKVGATKSFVLANGAPAILFRSAKGVFAYSAICTHQGCTVEYQPATKVLQCPCHQAQFDPFKSAKPVSGPAINPLGKVKVAVKGAWVVLA